MPKYIDADVARRIIDSPRSKEQMLMVLSQAEPADVVKVVHGENISKGGFLCSVCKFGDFNGFHGYEPNFCPHCGADMRGGQNELHKRL